MTKEEVIWLTTEALLEKGDQDLENQQTRELLLKYLGYEFPARTETKF